MENISGIYKITNKTTNKIYIGSSKNIEERWKAHINLLNRNKHNNNHLQHAWNKYGNQDFEFEIIEICDLSNLIEREQYYIDYYNCCDHNIGYNIMPSASMSIIPKEVKEKISNTLTGKYQGEKCFYSIYSEEQILNVIDDLLENKLSCAQIAQKHNVSFSVVRNVKYKNSWTYLTKDLEFPSSNNNFEYLKKLTVQSVQIIINMLIEGYSDNEIAQKFLVNRKTISDIRHHRTWKKLTEDYVFPSSNSQIN